MTGNVIHATLKLKISVSKGRRHFASDVSRTYSHTGISSLFLLVITLAMVMATPRAPSFTCRNGSVLPSSELLRLVDDRCK